MAKLLFIPLAIILGFGIAIFSAPAPPIAQSGDRQAYAAWLKDFTRRVIEECDRRHQFPRSDDGPMLACDLPRR